MKILLLVILALALVFGAGAFLLPSTYAVERSTEIAAGPSVIAPYLTDLKTWQEWTAWNKQEIPELEYSFGDTTTGVGASMSWTEESGEGSLEITEVTPSGGIVYTLEFDQGKFVSQGRIDLEKLGEGQTRVVWTDAGELGNNPLYRWFGLALDKMMGPDFQKGLDQLKAKVEQGS